MSRPDRWPPERQQAALELWGLGRTLAQAAAELHTKPGTLSRVLREAGIDTRDRARYRESYRAAAAQRPKTQPWIWTPERHEQVAQMYLNGMLQEEIAAELQTSQARVSRSLREQGVQLPRTGRRNSAWRGGRVLDPDGYVLVSSPGHPFAAAAANGRSGYVREHRLVLEGALGRYLHSEEVVHHMNGDRSDNRLENLQLFASNGEHLRHELTGRCPNWSEDGRRRIHEAVARPRKRRSTPGHPTVDERGSQ